MKLLQADSAAALAECAAKITIDKLNSAIHELGEATWVLAGGSTPIASYDVIVSKYADAVDWQKVWFVIGDERHVPLNDSLSNWGAANDSLTSKLNISQDHLIKPEYSDDLNAMASSYSAALSRLPKASNGLPRLDVVWLGLGEDGHTLSLFPGRNLESEKLVEPITDSLKLPSGRISLTLFALRQTRCALILASGENKAEAVNGLINEDQRLPISQAVKAIESSYGQVCLLSDKSAHSSNM